MALMPEETPAVTIADVPDDAYLVDVRNPDEYEVAHVPGAHLVPLAELDQRTAEIPKDRTVHVICKSGGRSARAVDFLNASGWDTVNVLGGTDGWIAAGRPVDEGSAP
jgi:rhodanese-related sulfurtransferase